MSNPISAYPKFSSEPHRFKLSFLFCSDPVQFQRKYSLDEDRSKEQIQMQARLLPFVRFLHVWCSSGFTLFLLFLAYQNVLITGKFETVLFYFIVFIKLAGYSAFIVSMQSWSHHLRDRSKLKLPVQTPGRAYGTNL